MICLLKGYDIKYTGFIYKNLKPVYLFVVLSFLTFVLNGCNEEIKIKDNSEFKTNETIYISFEIKSPCAPGMLRGEENKTYGQPWENEIDKVVLLIANPENDRFFCSITIDKEGIEDDSDNSVKNLKGKLEFNKLKDAALEYIEKETLKVKIFAICNPPSDFKIPSAGESVQQILTVDNYSSLSSFGGLPGKDGYTHPFLMTNGDFPQDWENGIDGDPYVVTLNLEELSQATEAVPYRLKNEKNEPLLISVQRSLARIDLPVKIPSAFFDEVGKKKNITDPGEEWTYSVTLNYVSLINLNKNFYLFKETIDDGAVHMFWNEKTPTSEIRYVKDPFFGQKKTLIYDFSNHSLFYHNDLFSTEFITNISNYPSAIESQISPFSDYNELISSSPRESENESEYLIWNYFTPNTIEESEFQKSGLATGILFIARLDINENSIEFKNDHTPLYFRNGLFLGTWKSLVNGEGTSSNISLESAKKLFKSTFTQEEFSSWQTSGTLTAEMGEKLMEKGFGIYYPYDLDGDGTPEYYCYYYIWIKHEDNNNSRITGPMEFGIVRNNVYQIGINAINRIGHPMPSAIHSTDPDAPSPQDDCEYENPYLSFKVSVKDWELQTDENVSLF